MLTLTISITTEILRQSAYCGMGCSMNSEGEIKSEYPTNCAVALAVRDVFPKAEVHKEYILPYGKHSWSYIGLPKVAKEFVQRFDGATPEYRMNMKPFSFDIELPEWVINRIDISEITTLLQNHPTLKLQTY